MFELYLSIAVITGFSLVLAVKEYLSYKERHEMMDRLMAKNLEEYKLANQPEEKQPEAEDDGFVDIEDAREEILRDAEED